MPLRLDRYSSILRKEISDILFKQMGDQKLGLVSITYVKLSKDASQAWVHYTHLSTGDDRETVHKKLSAAAKFIKGEIGRVIKNVTVPDLIFVYDESIDRGVHMSQRIDEIINADINDA